MNYMYVQQINYVLNAEERELLSLELGGKIKLGCLCI